jgi:hypothetical protein
MWYTTLCVIYVSTEIYIIPATILNRFYNTNIASLISMKSKNQHGCLNKEYDHKAHTKQMPLNIKHT